MADETSVIKIQYDTDEAVTAINDLTKAIANNEARQKELKEQLKQGKISQQDYATQMAETTQTLNRDGFERKKYINIIQAEVGSVKRAKAENQILREERNKLSTATKVGRDRIAELNKKIDMNTVAIKGNVDQQSRMFMSFGKISQSLKSIPGPIGGVIRGLGGMTKAAIAFIATPLGAIIAAIVLGFKALTAYLRGSEEGQNRLNKIMMVFKTIMGNLGDIVQKVGKWIFEAVTKPKEAIKELGDFIVQNLINRFLAFGEIGKAIVKIFSKNWKEGFKDLANASIMLTTGFENVIDKAIEFGKEVGKEMEKDIAIAQKLADRQAALDLLQRKFLVEREKMEAQIAEARVKASDKEKFTAQERIIFLEEALQTEMKIFDTDFKIAKEKFEIKKAQNALSNSTKEDLNEQAQLEADMFRVQRENATKRMALTSQLTSAQRELNAEQKKQGEGSEKTNEADEKAQAEMLKRRGEAIMKLAELKARELELEAKSYDEKRDLQVSSAAAELAAKLGQEGILQEEIELAEQEHKIRMSEIEAEYQENIRAQRQMALDESFFSMQEIINATAGMANQRVNILSDAFSKISTINFKEVKSAQDAFLQIGQAAQGLTNLIVSGNQAQLDDLEAKKTAELELAGDNIAAQEAIGAKYNKKLVAIKKAQAKEEKRKARIDAAIAMALGIVKALGSSPPPVNFVMAGLVAALGGVQIATIARQQEPEFSSDKIFAKGGAIVNGASHAQGGVNVFGDNGQYFGNVQGQEAMFVMNKDATAEIAAYSQINESHGGRNLSGRAGAGTFQDGGQMAGINVNSLVDEAIQRTPIVVRVGDIETGMTDFNNVKKAGVI
jgi:hypothetical protein